MQNELSMPEAPTSTWLGVLVLQLEQRAQDGDLMAELVLELGDLETGVPRPAGMRRGRRRYCFATAERRACLTGDGEPRYQYVEGYALSGDFPVPIHHAWISEGRGAIEVTWSQPGLAYMGIRFGCRERAILFLRYRQDGVLPPLTSDAKGAVFDRARLTAG